MKKILVIAVLAALSTSANAWERWHTRANAGAGSVYHGSIDNTVSTSARTNGTGFSHHAATAGASLDASGYAQAETGRYGQVGSQAEYAAGVADEKTAYTSVYGNQSGNASGGSDARSTVNGWGSASGFANSQTWQQVDPYASSNVHGNIDNSLHSHSSNRGNGEAWTATAAGASLDLSGYAATDAHTYAAGAQDAKTAYAISNGFADNAHTHGEAAASAGAWGGVFGIAADGSRFRGAKWVEGTNNFQQLP